MLKRQGAVRCFTPNASKGWLTPWRTEYHGGTAHLRIASALHAFRSDVAWQEKNLVQEGCRPFYRKFTGAGRPFLIEEGTKTGLQVYVDYEYLW